MLIRGFSENTSYTCASCHLKCCATEFNLPLYGSEIQILSNKFPEYRPYFQSSKDGDFLLRGDSCPFLTTPGYCQLHSISLKPITCLIYPLIFWRFNEDDYLVSIHPCRGKGFQWYTPNETKITNSYINQLLIEAKKYFSSFWGENTDKNNPYVDISSSRVKSQLQSYHHISEYHLLEKIVEDISFSSLWNIFSSEFERYIEILKNDEVGKYLNSVLNWLIWSPVGLQLSLQNSQLLFSTAAIWLIELSQLVTDQDSFSVTNADYYNQLSSFYASCILPSFWFRIKTDSQNKTLISFSNKVQLVLRGELPQENLSQFFISHK